MGLCLRGRDSRAKRAPSVKKNVGPGGFRRGRQQMPNQGIGLPAPMPSMPAAVPAHPAPAATEAGVPAAVPPDPRMTAPPTIVVRAINPRPADVDGVVIRVIA